MPGSGSSPSLLDQIKSIWPLIVAFSAIIFSAGSIYNLVNETDLRSKSQETSISSIKDNQVRMLESFERMEKYSKESDEKMIKGLEQVNQKMSRMEERIIKNEIKIDRIEADFYKK